LVKELFFSFHMLGDIPQDDCKQFGSSDFDLRNRSLDREFFAVAPSPEHDFPCTLGSIGDAGLAKGLDLFPMCLTKSLWYEDIEWLADGFGRRTTKHLFRSLIEEDNALVGIYRNNGIHG
jgi:hypothetical protein